MKLTNRQLRDFLVSRGWSLAREYYPWGRCEMWRKYRNGVHVATIYNEGGELLTWTALRDRLRRDWRPVASADVDWYMQNIA